MKTLLLLAASLPALAAPITFTATGAVSAIPNGYFVNLINLPGSANDRTATFTASEPLQALSLYANNLPFQVGSGWIFSLDGAVVLNTGIGNLVQQALTFVSVVPFTTLRVETNFAPGLLERGNLTSLEGTPWEKLESPVPEPGTGILLAGVFCVAAWAWCLSRIASAIPPTKARLVPSALPGERR